MRPTAGAAIDSIADNVAVAVVDSLTTERDQWVRLRFWYRVQVVQPDTIQVGIFSLAQQVGSDTVSFDTNTVNAAVGMVRTARYGL